MMELLGRRRNSISRMVNIAAMGAATLWFTKNYDSAIRFSVPCGLQESVSRPQYWTVNTVPPRSFGLPIFSFNGGNEASVGPNEEPMQSSVCLGRDCFANAAARVGPAVVNIAVNKGMYDLIGGNNRTGSGTIIDKDGTILTCAHGVADFHEKKWASQGRLDVTLQDGRKFSARVVNVDLHLDIAILKIDSETPLPEAKLGSSSTLRTGDWVIAMGSPLKLHNTVTVGIVSCVDRKSSELGIQGVKREYLQTDCAINPGNSGGPLVNVNGEVVGVNIMQVSDAQGLSFAVPIDSAKEIIQKKKNVQPWIGLTVLDHHTALQELESIGGGFSKVKRGVFVETVVPGSPADRAGFLPNDLIVQFDGRFVETAHELGEIMSDRVGEAFEAVVLRRVANDSHIFSLLTVTAEGIHPTI